MTYSSVPLTVSVDQEFSKNVVWAVLDGNVFCDWTVTMTAMTGAGTWEPEQLGGGGQCLPPPTWALLMGCWASSQHGGQGQCAWLHGNSGLTHRCSPEPSGDRTNIYDLASKTHSITSVLLY